MRDALRNAVQNAILFECKLPHLESGLDKSCISSQNDLCFSSYSPNEIAKVIYNGIVEFAVNEYKINYEDLALEQVRAIKSRITKVKPAFACSTRPISSSIMAIIKIKIETNIAIKFILNLIYF